tara:strand:- start:3562 stop:3819 length:258 start_codon:yes stop_codon:yes gene_type:complete
MSKISDHKHSRNLGPQINLDNDKCWISFLHNGWLQKWFPLMMNGRHLDFCDNFCMEIAREKFGDTKFGIANTKQMLMKNDCRNNF